MKSLSVIAVTLRYVDIKVWMRFSNEQTVISYSSERGRRG